MGSGDVCVGAQGRRRPCVSELCCVGTAQLPQCELQFVAALPSHRIPPPDTTALPTQIIDNSSHRIPPPPPPPHPRMSRSASCLGA